MSTGRWKLAWSALALAVAASAPAFASFARQQAPGAIAFERDVQPILATNCVRCHGADKSKADLRLDLRERAFAGANGGTSVVIVPGNSGASSLYQRIASGDELERMPLDEPALTPEQIATLRAWIDQGAAWPDELAGDDSRAREHWAWNAPKRPVTPDVRDTRWPRNPTDLFVLSRLELEALDPTPEADRATLLRRVSLDLNGLPPTPEETREFLADARVDAYELAVERLLASVRYGERMASAWLDLARYADSHGYEKDARREMWRYRDWVIDAFNRNLPFDQFTILQLAGDLLPNASIEQQIATGFHRNTMLNEEGGTDPEEFRVDAVLDRVNTTATVWMGATLACAQCHDHKFDPFTQRDYYRMFAAFNGTADGGKDPAPTIAAPYESQAHEDERLARETAELETAFERDDADLDAEQRAWERATLATLPPPTDWRVLEPLVIAATPRAAEFKVLDDRSVLVVSAIPDQIEYRVEFKPPATRFNLLRLEALADPLLPGGGPGRADNGNFVLSRLNAEISGTALCFAAAESEVEQSNGPHRAAQSLDDDPESGWAIGGNDLGVDREALFCLDHAAQFDGTQRFAVTLQHASKYARHALGRWRISIAYDEARGCGRTGPKLTSRVESVLRLDATQRTDEQRSEMRDYFRRSASERGGELWRKLEDLRARHKALAQAISSTYVMAELPAPRESRMFVRGSFLSPGEIVEPGVPALFGEFDTLGEPARLSLARWLVSERNPLAARVAVNRLWEQLFGRGLVATSEDFGTRGEPPTHPELLDWLACELVESGWDVKALVREIVTSAAYRQSSHASALSRERDPDNALCSRGARRRVEAETLRDIALAASGLLVERLGGPSVFPPQPAGIWNSAYSSDDWKSDDGANRWRRGLYTFWKRTAPYATFTLFEAPSREVTCTRRARTNTPLQALALLDDPALVEMHVALARRLLREAPQSDEARIARGFELCVSRAPDADEVASVRELVGAARREFAAAPERARERVAAGPADAQADLDAIEVAAWTSVACVLLNLDEALSRP